jgi:Rhodopirellula transposase DDE domain
MFRAPDCGQSSYIQKPADELGVPCTSKWNKVERRLFSFTSSWRGKPLASHRVVIQLIAATLTRSQDSLPTRLKHLSGRHPGVRGRYGAPCLRLLSRSIAKRHPVLETKLCFSSIRGRAVFMGMKLRRFKNVPSVANAYAVLSALVSFYF